MSEGFEEIIIEHYEIFGIQRAILWRYHSMVFVDHKLVEII